jgi:hypothetical protein
MFEAKNKILRRMYHDLNDASNFVNFRLDSAVLAPSQKNSTVAQELYKRTAFTAFEFQNRIEYIVFVMNIFQLYFNSNS